jgi:hypothetical protein
MATKIDTLHFIKIKIFHALLTQYKGNLWNGKTVANHVSDKVLTSGIYKNSFKSTTQR